MPIQFRQRWTHQPFFTFQRRSPALKYKSLTNPSDGIHIDRHCLSNLLVDVPTLGMMRVAQQEDTCMYNPLGRASAVVADSLESLPLLGIENDTIFIGVTHGSTSLSIVAAYQTHFCPLAQPLKLDWTQ